MKRLFYTFHLIKIKQNSFIVATCVIALFLILHGFITRRRFSDDNSIYDNQIIVGSSSNESASLQVNESRRITDVIRTTASSQMSPLIRKTQKDMCLVPPTLPEVLQKRQKDAQEACDQLRKDLPLRWKRKDRGPSSGILSKLRWDPQRHIVYCHLPKVASTTWAWHLLRSAGLKDEDISAHPNVHILLRERLPPPSVEDHDYGFLKDSLSFLVSRHPFHRLVSAYENKIVEAEKRREHYVTLRRLILNKYHHQKDVTNSTIPTFRDFCEYVADTTEEWLGDLDHKGPPDLHWMPMTYVCSPCNLHYDVYSKIETMEEDTRYIATQCGLEDVIKADAKFNPSYNEQEEEKEERVNEESENIPDNAKNNAKSGIENNIYDRYIKELSKEEIDRLYNIYKFDFEIFGYNIDDYR